MKKLGWELTIEFRGHELTLKDVYYDGGKPAQIYGPPEKCYPADPEEINYSYDTGNDLLDELLDSDFDDEIVEIALEAVRDEMVAQKEEHDCAVYDEYKANKEEKAIERGER